MPAKFIIREQINDLKTRIEGAKEDFTKGELDLEQSSAVYEISYDTADLIHHALTQTDGYEIWYNSDGEFGQKTGWLLKTCKDGDCFNHPLDKSKRYKIQAPEAPSVDVEGLENKIKNIRASYSNYGLELKCGEDHNTTLDYGRVQGIEIAIKHLKAPVKIEENAVPTPSVDVKRLACWAYIHGEISIGKCRELTGLVNDNAVKTYLASNEPPQTKRNEDCEG